MILSQLLCLYNKLSKKNVFFKLATQKWLMFKFSKVELIGQNFIICYWKLKLYVLTTLQLLLPLISYLDTSDLLTYYQLFYFSAVENLYIIIIKNESQTRSTYFRPPTTFLIPQQRHTYKITRRNMNCSIHEKRIHHYFAVKPLM